MKKKSHMCLRIDAHLKAAKELAVSGSTDEAERMYKQALAQADRIGESNTLAGLVLIEIADLYEKQGRFDEAEPAWERIRIILRENADKVN
jgi:tetratricopeptide (TPR) repeat protein